MLVLGFIYALMAVAFTMNVRAWLNWFLGSALIYSCLMVPTVTVRVVDRINPSLAPAVVDNVPLGLGAMASFTSQVGDWLTRTAETVFVMPSQLNYSTNGMIYGARLFDMTRNFQIRDAEFATNLQTHFKNCVFGDILLNRKSLTQLAQSRDLWADLGPGSAARGQPWIQRDGDGTPSQIVICQTAYSMLSAQWTPMIDASTSLWGKEAYPRLSTEQASAKLRQDVPIVNAAFTNASSDYTGTMRQVAEAQHRMPLAAMFGSGTASSSDGQNFPLDRRAQATGAINPHKGSDPAVSFYTHVSDRYAPYHSRVISAGADEAAHVLDGLLHHGADLAIERHHTDGGGVSDHVFALCHLLGFRFAPRIPNIAARRLPLFTDMRPGPDIARSRRSRSTKR